MASADVMFHKTRRIVKIDFSHATTAEVLQAINEAVPRSPASAVCKSGPFCRNNFHKEGQPRCKEHQGRGAGFPRGVRR